MDLLPKVLKSWRALTLGLLALTGCPKRVPSPPPVSRAPQVLDAGRVVLACEPPDSSVTLDGVPMGLCSDYARVEHGLPVGNGMHHLVVRHAGYARYETDLAPDLAGERVSVTLSLDASGAKSR